MSTEDGTARVNGGLGVSRAFGDARYPCINAEPDVKVYPLQGKASQLIMGCDGLWDVFTPEEAAKEAARASGQKKTVAQHLVDEAIARGSSDNVSVIVVDL